MMMNRAISHALTPSHLIYGRQISSVPNDKHYDIVSTNQLLTKRAKYHQRVLNQFIKEWKTEYLLSLRESSKSNLKDSDNGPIAVGDMVILRNDNTRRMFWKLAKVEELLPSSDGVVRSAKVRLNGEGGKPITLRRPIQHLIPLEVRATTKEENVRDRSREEENVRDRSHEENVRDRSREEDVRDISRTDQPNAEKLRNNQLQRTRRKAAITGEMARRLSIS